MFPLHMGVAAPGDGINLGKKLSLTPGLQLELGYDSNVARLSDWQAQNSRAGQKLSSSFLQIHPSLTAAYNRDDLKLGFSLDQYMRLYTRGPAQYYPDYDPSADSPLGVYPSPRDYSYFDNLDVRLNADIAPQGMIGLVLRESFSIRNYGIRDPGDELFWDARRVYNEFSATGRYSPGSALDLNLGLRWLHDVQDFFEYFSGGSPNDVTNAPSKNELGTLLRGKWRFYPKTALLVEGSYSGGKWRGIPECGKDLSETVGETCPTDRLMSKSDRVNIWDFLVGISGQFTPVTQARVFLGYGNLYNPDSTDAEKITGGKGILADLALIYSPLESQHITAEFRRKFGDAAILDYGIFNGFFITYSGSFAAKLEIDARLGYDIREPNSAEVGETQSSVETVELPTRSQRLLSGQVRGNYRLTPWLKASALLRLTSSGNQPTTGSLLDTAILRDYYDYNGIVVTIGVRGVY